LEFHTYLLGAPKPTEEDVQASLVRGRRNDRKKGWPEEMIRLVYGSAESDNETSQCPACAERKTKM